MSNIPFHERMAWIADVARRNGCRPHVTSDGIPWCTCRDELHYSDQQCSMITLESAKRRRLTEVS